jgi:uncharacterized membrane protein (DUF106 family)
MANNIRQRVRSEQVKQRSAFEQQQSEELKRLQAHKLLLLQQQYHDCLDEVGMGHMQAALQVRILVFLLVFRIEVTFKLLSLSLERTFAYHTEHLILVAALLARIVYGFPQTLQCGIFSRLLMLSFEPVMHLTCPVSPLIFLYIEHISAVGNTGTTSAGATTIPHHYKV